MEHNSKGKGFLEGMLSAVGIVKSNIKPVITINNTSYNTSRKAHSHIKRFRPCKYTKRSAFKKPVGFKSRPYNTSAPVRPISSHIKRLNPTPKKY